MSQRNEDVCKSLKEMEQKKTLESKKFCMLSIGPAEDWQIEALEVAKRTIRGLHEGSTTEELDELSISNAVMLMGEEPNYSKVAARMLSESIRKEVGRNVGFRDYRSRDMSTNFLTPLFTKSQSGHGYLGVCHPS